jgi:hypothetical protein
MARRKPFPQADIEERQRWLEVQAALGGPKVYEACGILTPNQRRELIQLARVTPEEKKQFIDDVTCNIIQYRIRERGNAQEKPAAVAEAMRRLINAYEQVVAVSINTPDYVRLKVCSAIEIGEPTGDGIKRAKEELSGRIGDHRVGPDDIEQRRRRRRS